MTKNKGIVHTEELKRRYLLQDTVIKVLNGINLTIYEQEFVAIMGKSGSGKTTLLKIIGLLDRPSEGRVYFKGKDSELLRGDKLAEIRRREIGFIYQDYYLMDSLSVKENIMLPQILDHRPVEECLSKTLKLAKLMRVDQMLDKRTYELSGGEKQRVAICRALINQPDLVLADEPTGNLDSGATELVMNYLKMINEEINKTIVLVTHDANVASYCERVLFVKDGMIESQIRKRGEQSSFYDEILEEQRKIIRG